MKLLLVLAFVLVAAAIAACVELSFLDLLLGAFVAGDSLSLSVRYSTTGIWYSCALLVTSDPARRRVLPVFSDCVAKCLCIEEWTLVTDHLISFFGSGTDFTAFYQHLRIAPANLAFGMDTSTKRVSAAAPFEGEATEGKTKDDSTVDAMKKMVKPTEMESGTTTRADEATTMASAKQQKRDDA
jgi:hypothetical protein